MSSSLAPECSALKEKYDSCFIRWYSEKFLRGDNSSNECETMFKEYRTCLEKHLNSKGINKMLEDARNNHVEGVAISDSGARRD